MKPGRKRILCVSAILLAGLMALFVWEPWGPPEPVYQGKTLTAWVEQWQSGVSLQGRGREKAREAESAIRQIGTNGIPFLLHLLATEEHPAKPWLRTKVQTSWHGRLGLVNMEVQNKRTASTGLMLLGTNAVSVAPAVINLLSRELSSSSPDANRFWTVLIPLSSMQGAADPAIPLLINCLSNKSYPLIREAVQGLGLLQRMPEVVVPALLNHLADQKMTNRPASIVAIQSISKFGTNAIAASPVLVSLLDGPDNDLGVAAADALQQIDRSAAERSRMRDRSDR